MNIFNWIKTRVFSRPRKGNNYKIKKIYDKIDNLKRRRYTNYQEYINHQSEKLSQKLEQITLYDSEYENIVYERYLGKFTFNSKSIICLAARLGGEVRAFKRLGALAIGIDLEPGKMNRFVLHGDFHNLQFADDSFDLAFTNAIDHVFDLEKFLIEVKRVLKKDGIFIIEFAEVKPGYYEVLDTNDIKPILKIIENHFEIKDIVMLQNKTDFVAWDGKIIFAKK